VFLLLRAAIIHGWAVSPHGTDALLPDSK